ncbi:Ig-like domain-containing protein, partial [Aeromonas hydrophila]
NWSFTPKALEEGDHSFTTRATDAAGNTSATSPAWNIEIDVTAPSKPGSNGEGPGLHEIGGRDGPIKNGGTTNDNTPTFNGKGEPGDTIVIFDNNQKIGEVVVGENGTWEFTPETALGDGDHAISIIIQDPAGNQSPPSDSQVIVIDTQAPDAPVLDNVDPRIPSISGTAEANTHVDIFDNDVLLGSTIADSQGNWSFTPKALEEGDHSFTTRATDSAGNVSEQSPAWEIEITLAPPARPSIESIYDDVGAERGTLTAGSVTDDNRPRITGSSDPLTTVIIFNHGMEIGRAQADGQGNWSFTPESALADGIYSLSTVAIGTAGRSSETSEPFEVIVYTGNGPTQVARLSHMGKDSGVDGHDFVTDNGSFGRLMYGVLSAELNAGQALMVSTDGGNSWFEAQVNGTQWVAQDLNKHQGNWSIQTRIQGASGEAGFVMEQGVVLDTTAPRAPTSIQLNGSNLHIAFDASNVAAGDRISVVADGGAQRFDYTLTASDIDIGSVNLDVGLISSASAALVDRAGNLSGFANTGSAPKANFVLTDDVSEVYGTSRNNVFTIEDVSVLQNIKLLEGNGGEDTLKLAGANQLLDFSVLQSRLSSIEVIDITGTGNNTLRISLSDILELGHHNAFMDEETVQLAIRGDVGDSVELSHLLLNGMDVGDWEITGSVTVAGYQYEVYRHTELSADLLVQQGVSVQQV